MSDSLICFEELEVVDTQPTNTQEDPKTLKKEAKSVKEKRPRKPMSEEHKEKLRNNLKRVREARLEIKQKKIPAKEQPKEQPKTEPKPEPEPEQPKEEIKEEPKEEIKEQPKPKKEKPKPKPKAPKPQQQQPTPPKPQQAPPQQRPTPISIKYLTTKKKDRSFF